MLADARRFHADEADAGDAMQDAFVSAFRGIDSFGGGTGLGTWLHSIVARACLMKLRSRHRRPERPIENLLPCYVEDSHRLGPAPAWSEPADRLAQREESRSVVRRCIGQLPDACRAVLLLRDIEEYDTEEAARLLGLNPNAVKTRLHRARQALRTLLDPYFGAGREGLRNVLPAGVAEELKQAGRVRPVEFESASVLFTDFAGFTRVAEGLTPQALVGELDRCFRRFDHIARRRGLEKIKTIGDAYIAAGGVPAPTRTHAADCVLAALEVQ